MKKILIAFAFVSMSLMSQASYLYWQVQSGDFDTITEPGKVDTAYLYATKEGAADQKIGALKIDNTQEYYAIDVSSYATGGYSFYIELVNYNSGAKDVLGYGESVAYADMVEKGHILETPLSITSANVWHGGTYAAPEPTSAMMILLGLAGIALKRKRV